MKEFNIFWLGALLVSGLFQTLCFNAEGSSNSLFDPTPRDEWRAMSADRPDFTESPTTVDAGVRQLELSFFDYTRGSDADDTLAFIPLNLKIGLRHNMDLQLVVMPTVWQNSKDDGGHGVGDTELRLKINLWGNDGAVTAMALMPYLKVPTASGHLGNGKVEGGFIVPFALSLTDRLGLGLMLEVDGVYDEGEDRYDADVIVSGVLGYQTETPVAFYVEGILLAKGANDHELEAILGVGATYAIDANTQLDIGCNLGLSESVDDFNIFSGVTVRF